MDDKLEVESVLSKCGIPRPSVNAGKIITQDKTRHTEDGLYAVTGTDNGASHT